MLHYLQREKIIIIMIKMFLVDKNIVYYSTTGI